MGNHALMTLLAWPYPGRERLPPRLAARLDTAGLLPLSDMPGGHPHGGRGPMVLAGDTESGPILAGAPAHHASACDVLIAGLAAAGLHVYVGRGPAGGYCAVWDYHPPGTGKHAVRHRCCDRDRPPNRTERSRDPDDALECQLDPWARLMLGSPAGVPAMVLLAAH
jgi:hypothetical protein